MYQLGNTRFEGLKGFDALGIERSADFAYHEKIGTKPSTQRVGDKLEKLDLVVRFEASYCKPEAELDALERSRRVGYILALVSGDGRYYGDYLIETLRYDIERQGPDGGVFSMRVTLGLVEYFYEDRAAAARRAAKASAFARAGVARPFPQTPANSLSPEAALTRRITQIIGTVVQIATTLRHASTNTTRRQYLVRELARQTSGLSRQVGQAQTFINLASGGIQGGGSISAALAGGGIDSFPSAASRVSALAASGNLAGATQASGQLQGLAAKLKTASQQSAVAVATGKTQKGGQ